MSTEKTIFSHGRNIPLVETYKGYNIVCENGTFMVHDPKKDTLFIVCMDDSKMSGARTFDDAHNSVESARSHIDFLWESMEFIADLDETTGLFCVFNSKVRAVATYADKEEAQREADRLNERLYSAR